MFRAAVLILALAGLQQSACQGPPTTSGWQKVWEPLSELAERLLRDQAEDQKQYDSFVALARAMLGEANRSLAQQRRVLAGLEASRVAAEATQAEQQGVLDKAVESLVQTQEELSSAASKATSEESTHASTLQNLQSSAMQIGLALEAVVGSSGGAEKPEDVAAGSSLLRAATRSFERSVEEDRDPSDARDDIRGDREYTLTQAFSKVREAIRAGAGELLSPGQRQILGSFLETSSSEALTSPPSLGFLQVRSRGRASSRKATTAAPAAEVTNELKDMLMKVQQETSQEILATKTSQLRGARSLRDMKAMYEEEIEAQKAGIEEIKLVLGASREQVAKDSTDLLYVQRSLQAMEAQVSQVGGALEEQSIDFEKRRVLRSKELEAVKQAMSLLTGASDSAGPLSLVQVSSRKSLVSLHRRSEGRDIQSSALASSGPQFAGSDRVHYDDGEPLRRLTEVKGLLKDMMQKLQDATANDTKQEDWCKKEKASSLKSSSQKQRQLEKLESQDEAIETELEAISVAMRTSAGKVKDLKASIRAAEAQRAQEKSTATNINISFQEEGRLLRRAVALLQEASIDLRLQDRKMDDNRTAVAPLLRFSLRTLADLVAEADSAEERAEKSFVDLKDTAQARISAYQKSMQYQKELSTKLAAERSSLRLELRRRRAAAKALELYMHELKSKCDGKAGTYTEDKDRQRREQQARLLSEAHEILKDREDNP
eukprot:TRINITY_DN21459_c0_g2_i1.p1 TRINITY_DN21459_c0_g2~~TRINITY_DN21459_c0_g2_i1.p1  ORF type:complete len:717 (-),score=227.87 TRINITY_DN21459_c0_g2_i1:60-2210(-)